MPGAEDPASDEPAVDASESLDAYSEDMVNDVDDEPEVSYLEDEVPPAASEPTAASDPDVSMQPQMSHAAAVAATIEQIQQLQFLSAQVSSLTVHVVFLSLLMSTRT